MKALSKEETKDLLSRHNLVLAKNSSYHVGLFSSSKGMTCTLLRKNKLAEFGFEHLLAVDICDEAQIDSTLTAFSKHIHAIYPL